MKSLFEWCRENNRADILQCYLDADNPVSPEFIGFSSGKQVRWKCTICGLTWASPPNKINRKRPDRSICPFCNHKRPSSLYNAAILYPEMLPYWDFALNQGDLREYLPKSKYCAYWKCSEGHSWTRAIGDQAAAIERYRHSLSQKKGGLCPYCNHERVSAHYNLEEVCSDVAKQWNYTKNGALTPRNVSPYSQKKVFWQCSFNPAHVWADRISNRTILLRGCPICSKHFHISYSARAIYYYLHQSGICCSCEMPVGRYKIDIEISPKAQEASPIALEVDGYWHRFLEAVQRDAKKDVFLRQKGYRVIRLKEQTDQEEIQVNDDVITYPVSDRNRYLNRIIQYVLMLVAGIHLEPDHVSDHWKIEEFYYHTRRERSLAVQYPALAQEWSGRNPDVPEVVSPGLSSKRWWKCPKCEREYQATVSNRTRYRSSCPFCSHLRVTPETCLAAVFPTIAAEWDYEKNAPLKPTEVLPGTDKRVWWKCNYGHRWQTWIYSRTGPAKSKCPFCQGNAVEPRTSLAFKTPEVARYWHPTKNDLTSREVAPHSNRIFWWKCPNGHEWQDMPQTLQKYPSERICPFCDHRRLSKDYCLAAHNRNLAALWHPSKNACTPEEIAPHSNKKVWWLCEKGHEWQESVGRMQTLGTEKACPYCNNRKVWKGNSLARLAPHLVTEWHPSKNHPLTPENVMAWSAQKAWWRCERGHTWQATPDARSRGSGCPFCTKEHRKKK